MYRHMKREFAILRLVVALGVGLLSDWFSLRSQLNSKRTNITKFLVYSLI